MIYALRCGRIKPFPWIASFQLPAFEKGDRFQMNIVNCALLGAFVRSMPERPKAERLTRYYAAAMMTAPMRRFCRKSGMRHLDYTMSEADGARAFVRQYTLPSGGPYCDCGYEKKKQVKVSGGSAL